MVDGGEGQLSVLIVANDKSSFKSSGLGRAINHTSLSGSIPDNGGDLKTEKFVRIRVLYSSDQQKLLS